MKPETADGFELAWASNGALGRQRTALYYNHYNNLISVDCGMNTNDPCLFYNTDDHSKIYGAEFEGRLNLNAFGLADGLAPAATRTATPHRLASRDATWR